MDILNQLSKSKQINEITEIRYLLGIGLYKIYSGENVDFYSEFGAEVAYSCQKKSNISAAVDQINLEELENIFENIDYVFNTQDDKNSNDDIEIIGKGGLISKGMFNLVQSSKKMNQYCAHHIFSQILDLQFFSRFFCFCFFKGFKVSFFGIKINSYIGILFLLYRLFFLRSIAQFFTQIIYMNCFVSS